MISNELAHNLWRCLAFGCTVSIAKRSLRSESLRIETSPFVRLGLDAVAIVALGTHRCNNFADVV
jgi:hypothetical protein